MERNKYSSRNKQKEGRPENKKSLEVINRGMAKDGKDLNLIGIFDLSFFEHMLLLEPSPQVGDAVIMNVSRTSPGEKITTWLHLTIETTKV